MLCHGYHGVVMLPGKELPVQITGIKISEVPQTASWFWRACGNLRVGCSRKVGMDLDQQLSGSDTGRLWVQSSRRLSQCKRVKTATVWKQQNYFSSKSISESKI